MAEQEELLEEHGGEEGALQDVSGKKEADQAQDDYTIQAWKANMPGTYKSFEALHEKYRKGEEALAKAHNHPYLDNLKNSRGSLTLKALKDRLDAGPPEEERQVLEDYLDTAKAVSASKRTISAQLKEAFGKLQQLIAEKPEADLLLELSVVLRYLELLGQESQCKSDIKAAEAELEAKVIQQYPRLRIEEIKTLAVDKKWMAGLHARIQTEMDGVSHRLAERIRELAERYEAPLPRLAEEVGRLEKKVQGHLEQMGYRPVKQNIFEGTP